MRLRHAHALHHGKLFSSGHNGSDHGIDKVQHAYQSDHDAHHIAHHRTGPCLTAILRGLGSPGGKRDVLSRLCTVAVQHFLGSIQMRILHVEEYFSRCILGPACPESFHRHDKFQIMPVLIFCASLFCPFRNDREFVEHRHDGIFLALDLHGISHRDRRQRLSLFLRHGKAGSDRIFSCSKLRRIIASGKYMRLRSVGIQHNAVQTVDHRPRTFLLHSFLYGLRSHRIVGRPIGQHIVRIESLHVRNGLLTQRNLCLMTVFVTDALQAFQRLHLRDQLRMQGITVRVVSLHVLFTGGLIHLEITQHQFFQILFHIKSGIPGIEGAHQCQPQRQGTDDRHGTLSVAAQIGPCQSRQTGAAAAPFYRASAPLHVIIPKRFHRRNLPRHSGRTHTGDQHGHTRKRRRTDKDQRAY